MDDAPTRLVCQHLPNPLLKCLAVLMALVLSSGCASSGSERNRRSALVPRNGYEVHFSASRLKDHSALISAAVPVALGEKQTVRTASKVATESTPALPQFTATLATTPAPGVFQLVTRVAIVETIRNKKGKLKTAKRNQGSLLPIRLGETQLASVAGDPVQVEVQVNRR